MSRYAKIERRIWNDAKFMGLADDAKLTFFLLLTHPNMTSLGAMKGSLASLADDLGWDAERFRKRFRELSQKGMAKHDPKARLTTLPNFIRYNEPENPNVVKGWLNALDMLPECDLKDEVEQGFRRFAETKGEGFMKPFRERYAKSVTVAVAGTVTPSSPIQGLSKPSSGRRAVGA